MRGHDFAFLERRRYFPAMLINFFITMANFSREQLG
jgi:hypothetical protein